MLKTGKLTLVLVAGAIGLAGCSDSDGGDGGSNAVVIDAAPASGPEISRDTYSFNLPADWEELPLDDAPEHMDVIAGDVTSEAEFMDNMNMSMLAETPPDLKEVEKEAPAELESGGAKDVQVNERIAVSDYEAAHVSADMSVIGDYSIEQFYLVTDDAAYMFTFSFGSDVDAAERVDVSKSVLATWSSK